MLPPFEIAGGLPLAVARGASVAGALSLCGALLARLVFVPSIPPPGLSRLRWLSLAVALLGGLAWGWAVAGTLADTPDVSDTAATLPVVLLHTSFGHLLLLRAALLAGAAVLARWRWLAAVLAIAAVLTQAGHSHALAMHPGPSLLLGSEALHLLAAAGWLGGLLPLLLLVRAAPAPAAVRACRRFSVLGTVCVAVLAGTALLQGWTLIGSLPAVVGTAYGLVACAKLLLFLVLVAFAARHRFRLAPALAVAQDARGTMLRSIAAETVFGVLVVLAAGVLTSLPPSMHTPTVWPFARRPSLMIVQADPAFLREVLAALLALAGAVALLVVAALLRRSWRWALVALAALIAWRAAPHLDLLLVDAYPTSFQHSPTGFASDSIVRGAALYPQYCASCHGAAGRGDGPAGRGLAIPPADLTAAHLWMHGDGELIWWLSHGIDGPEGGLAMPGFADVLSRDERWALIDFLHARNAGVSFHATGTWPLPLRAPAWQAICGGGRIVAPGESGDAVLRLIVQPSPSPPPAPPGVVTVVAGPHPPPGLCTIADAAVPAAYAIAGGVARADLPRSTFLIDAQGWLRGVQPGGARPEWDDPAALARIVADIRSHPLAASPAAPMSMPM